MNAHAVAALVGGMVVGDPSTPVTGVSDISNARPGDVTFAQSPKHAAAAAACGASVVIACEGLEIPGKTLIIVANPKYAFVRALSALVPPDRLPAGTDPSASVHPGASVAEGAHVGPLACVEEGAVLGRGAAVHAGARIGRGSAVGDGSVVHRNAVLYPGTRIGRDVIVHSGAVIGADGFGYIQEGKGLAAASGDAIERYAQSDEPHLKVPHFGCVVLEDGVEIGANTAIDRATAGSTVVGRGTKIDNLVQIGHNCVIGAHVIIVSMVGIGGSARIGDHVTIGGNCGISEGVEIGAFSIVGAHSLVFPGKKFGPRSVIWGNPARRAEKFKAQLAALSSLPKAVARIRGLEAAIRDLESRVKGLEG